MFRRLCVSSLCSSVVKSVEKTKMFSKFSYEDAVQKLNNLQSNKATIEQIRRDIRTGQKCTNLEDMEQYLYRTGVSLTKLDTLSVIHVAGTKGKGSTSAMCESILRHHGFKTGFYSSPHLVAVRERIRLDGKVINKETFTEYFQKVYEALEMSKAHEGDMPKYFAFMTVLAFNIFLKEKVDVAIIEVGIGGAVDYTNILRKVPVAGITALGLDHTSILGNTIEEIAEAKAGILKPCCEAYTVAQPPKAMSVLQRVANETKCPLHLVPDYNVYLLPKELQEQLPVEAYSMNASLAIQLSHAWMRVAAQNNIKIKYRVQENGRKAIRQNGFTIIDTAQLKHEYKNQLNVLNRHSLIYDVPTETVTGLKECKWPGRYQVIQSDYAKFCLDGAHTKESMEICASWFTSHNSYVDSILIFSATGDRDVEILLEPLKKINFVAVYFVIPTAYKQINEKNDNYSALEQNELIGRCYKYATIWNGILGPNNTNSDVKILECVSDAFISIKGNYHRNVSILITGSLHLVGAALSIIDHNLTE